MIIGRHAGSFFLKIGAALFCFGHIIHMGLNIVKTFYMKSEIEDEAVRKSCYSHVKISHDFMYPIFSLLQLFFVFKYGNVIVNKNKWLARWVAILSCRVRKNVHKIRTPTNQNSTSLPTVLEVILPSPVCKMPPRSCEDTNERKDLQLLKHLHS